MNGSDSTDNINKKAVLVLTIIVLAVLALAVLAGTFLGKSQAATKNEELSTNLTSSQQQLSQLQWTSASIQKDNDAIQTQLASSQQNNAALQVQMVTAQQSIAALQAQLVTAQQSINTLETQLVTSQQNINALQAQLAAWYTWTRNAPSVPTTTGPSIILSSTSGPPGTGITVMGSGFAANTSGNVFFDINRNGTSGPGEPMQNVTILSTSTFSTTLVVPSLPPDTYPVLAAFPVGAPAQASADFTVTTGAD